MTKRSLVTILVGLALLLIASTIRSGWLYLVASVLFGLVITAFFSGWLSVRKLEITRQSPAEVFESQPFSVRLDVSNKGKLAARLVSVRDLQFGTGKRNGIFASMRENRREIREYMRTGKAPPPRGRSDDSRTRRICFEELLPGRSCTVDYTLCAPARGVYPRATLKVSGGGLFGSGEIRKTVTTGDGITVFPSVCHLDSFLFDAMADQAAMDTIEWSRKGIGHDYYGTRPYVRGDSLKHIHWRSSARQGELIVKEYEQELKPSVVMVLALAAPSFGDDSANSLEDSLRAAASIVNFHESMGGLPLLVVPSGGTFAAFEAPTLFGCYRKLAEYEPPDEARDWPGWVAQGIQVAMESMLPGSSLVLVTNVPPLDAGAAFDVFNGSLAGSLVLSLDDSYGRGWKNDWLEEAPWLAAFGVARLRMYVITSGREIGRCLSEPLNTTG